MKYKVGDRFQYKYNRTIFKVDRVNEVTESYTISKDGDVIPCRNSITEDELDLYCSKLEAPKEYVCVMGYEDAYSAGDVVTAEHSTTGADYYHVMSKLTPNVTFTTVVPGNLFHTHFRESNIQATPKPCTHTWKRYIGFTDSYDYCEKCDAKRDERSE
jgi:hypothetical protein